MGWLTKCLKKRPKVVQGRDQDRQVINHFKDVIKECCKTFSEDNEITMNDFLLDKFCKAKQEAFDEYYGITPEVKNIQQLLENHWYGDDISSIIDNSPAEDVTVIQNGTIRVKKDYEL